MRITSHARMAVGGGRMVRFDVDSRHGVNARKGSHSLSPNPSLPNETRAGDSPASARRSMWSLDRGAENETDPFRTRLSSLACTPSMPQASKGRKRRPPTYRKAISKTMPTVGTGMFGFDAIPIP